jgi:hypothetical protein
VDEERVVEGVVDVVVVVAVVVVAVVVAAVVVFLAVLGVADLADAAVEDRSPVARSKVMVRVSLPPTEWVCTLAPRPRRTCEMAST